MKRITKLVAAAFGAVAMFVGSARADYTLAQDEDWTDGRTLSGTIDLAGHKLTVSSLTGNATITSSEPQNLIQDGSFEAATIPANGGVWSYFSSGVVSSYWQATDPGRVGITKGSGSGSPWTSWVIGTKAAFIQGDSSGDITLQQTVQVPEDGKYLLTYSYAWRPNAGTLSQRLEVRVDDGPACGYSDSSASVAVKEIVLDLTAGQHTIKFVGTTPHDVYATTILDDVSLRKISVGELHVLVQEGQVAENTTVAIAGRVRVVKEGAGTFVATKQNQSYTEGTEVAVGTFRCGAAGDTRIYGADGSTVTVREGATFDCDGWINHHLHHFVLDGGTMKSQNDRFTGDNAWFADVELTDDSFWSGCNCGFVGAVQGTSRLQMNGHVLTVDVTSGAFLAGDLTVEGGGEIHMRTGGSLALGGSSASGGKYVRAGTTTLRMGDAAIEDFGGEHVFGSYVSEYAGGDDVANTVIKVQDRFVPGTRWHATELQNGATLDLSACAGTWNTTCAFADAGTTAAATFADGAAIVLELGERELAGGMKLVGWTDADTPLPTVQFKLSDAVDPDDFMLVRRSDGLYVAAAVKTADWTGEVSADCNDPANWTCKDANGNVVDGALPGSITAVTLSGEVQLDIPAGSTFACASFTCDNVALKGDCDWRGLGLPVSGRIILAGRRLSVSSLMGDATITDSEPQNIIQDGTFEGVTIPSSPNAGVWAYFSTGASSPYWQTTVTDRAGFTKGSGSPFTSWVIGTKAALIQGDDRNGGTDVTLYQTVNVPADGQYLLTYSYGWRPGGKSQRMEVHVDDGPACGYSESSASVAVKEIVLDLTAGQHAIKFVGKTYDVWATTILDDVSLVRISAGELHISVPEGQTVENTAIAIAGPVRVVKEGAGTFVAKKQNQTYTGGTEVAAGTFRCGTTGDYHVYGADGGAVTVREGATFDCDGYPGHDRSHFVLDGGTVKNEPSHGYEILEYIESSGNAYVNTGVPVVSNTVIDIKVRLLTTLVGNPYVAYVGAREKNGTDGQFGGWFHGMNHYKGVNKNEANWNPAAVNTDYQVHLDKNGPCTIDGVQFDTGDGIGNGYNIMVFCLSQQNAPAFFSQFRVYSCRIAYGDAVQRDLRPARRLSDGALGLLDVSAANPVFYPNANSSGAFIAGPVSSSWFADVELTADSFMKGYSCGFLASNGGTSSLRMNGHRLTVDVLGGQHFHAGDLTVEGDGEIYMRAGGWLDLGGSSGSGGKYVRAGTTTLRMGNAAIYDVGGEHVFGSYVSEYGGGYDQANTVVKVLDRFVPGTRWHATELQDGATLDLSACAGAWNTACTFPNMGVTARTAFADGAAIVLELGEREPTGGMKLVGWTDADAPSPAVQFNLSDTVDPDNFMLDRRSDGLYVTAAVKTADWTGAVSADCNAPANWTCKDANGNVVDGALPGSITAVTLSGEVQLDIPAGSTFACASFTCDNASLKGDCDWRGLGLPVSGLIDLAGRKLTVSSFAGDATITDSVGENIIQDGSFEATTTPTTEKAGVWAYFSTGAASSYWQTTVPARVGFTKGNGSGSPWTSWVIGTKAALIQGDFDKDVTLQQTVQVPEDGTYLLAYSYAWRPGTAMSQHLEVHVDGGLVCGASDSGPAVAVNTIVLDLTAGPHTIQFVGTTRHDYATTILDDVSLRKISAGELHVFVPGGQTVENTTIAIAGPVRVVKEGAGTFVATKQNQTYCGGTEVAAGTFRCGTTGDNHIYGADGSMVTVREGATFDCDGYPGHDRFGFVLDGGTVKNETSHGYEILEYIDSSGKAYVNTGVTVASNTVIDIKVQLREDPGTDGYSSYVGARETYGTDGQFGGWFRGLYHYSAVKKVESGRDKAALNTDYLMHLDKNGPCTINGGVPFDTGSGVGNDYAITVFGLNQAGGVGFLRSFRVYSCRIAYGDVVQRDLRPARRLSDGALGLLDVNAANPVFYPNANSSGKFVAGPVSHSWFADVTLTKDSFMKGYSCGFLRSNGGASSLQMNGHRLTVDVTSSRTFLAGDLTVEGGGEIYMRTGGWFNLGGSAGADGMYVRAETTALRMGGAAINDGGGEHVFGSYVSEYHSGYDGPNSVIKVLDRFVPGVQWHATELQDGATLDLSAYASAWNTTCKFGVSSVYATATFAEGATIFVDLGERKVTSAEPVVTWSTKPANVKFRAVPGAAGGFSAKADGLYRSIGFGIIVR